MPIITGNVYLIHFEKKLAHAQHYIGYSHDIDGRMNAHKKGRGARLMTVIREKGIDWELARTWVADRNFERSLKNRKNAPSLCPICSGAAAWERAKQGE